VSLKLISISALLDWWANLPAESPWSPQLSAPAG
jgi:hypothetical protein